MTYDEEDVRLWRVIGALSVVLVALAATVVYLLLTRNDDDDAATTPRASAPSSPVTTTAVVVTETGAAVTPSTADAPVTPSAADAPVTPSAADAPVTPSAADTSGSAALVEDCVQYVPTAIYFGNAEMQAFWDSGGGTPEGLRGACERLALEDPARLLRMSEEYLALVAAVATTTTP
jgi:hypothetical protein